MLRARISSSPIALLSTDYGICDAARISLAKLATMFPIKENEGLLRYLHRSRHWSPYGHSREMFAIALLKDQWISFIEHAQLAGFTWRRGADDTVKLNGSLWAWYENSHHLPVEVARLVKRHLRDRYPMAGNILFPFSEDLRIAPSSWDLVIPLDQSELPQTLDSARLTYASFRVKAPIFIARQMVKHQIHLCWNEESRRYIDSEPEFFFPDMWRQRAPEIKQGSLKEPVKNAQHASELLDIVVDNALSAYNLLLALDKEEEYQVAPELARMVLPLNVMTNWVWTGSLEAWHRVVGLRRDSHAQDEASVLVAPFEQHLSQTFPSIWSALHIREAGFLG